MTAYNRDIPLDVLHAAQQKQNGTDVSIAAAVAASEPAQRTLSTKTASYGPVVGDERKILAVNAAGATTVTIPTNATQAFAVGTRIRVMQLGAGVVTIAAAGGVTVRRAGALTKQYGVVDVTKIATNEWVCSGDIA
jgi:hypothetical protein